MAGRSPFSTQTQTGDDDDANDDDDDDDCDEDDNDDDGYDENYSMMEYSILMQIRMGAPARDTSFQVSIIIIFIFIISVILIMIFIIIFIMKFNPGSLSRSFFPSSISPEIKFFFHNKIWFVHREYKVVNTRYVYKSWFFEVKRDYSA